MGFWDKVKNIISPKPKDTSPSAPSTIPTNSTRTDLAPKGSTQTISSPTNSTNLSSGNSNSSSSSSSLNQVINNQKSNVNQALSNLGVNPSTPVTTTKTTKPAVYYSGDPQQKWKPSDPNAIVIYLKSGGVTTGNTSAGTGIVPAGLNVQKEGYITENGKQKNIGNIGSYIANSLTLTTTTTAPLTPAPSSSSKSLTVDMSKLNVTFSEPFKPSANMGPQTFASGTRTDLAPKVKMTPEVNSNTFSAKAGDVFRSTLGSVGLSGGVFKGSSVGSVIGGATGNSMAQTYSFEVSEINKDFWKKGGPLNPTNVVNTWKDYYNLQQDTRAKTDLIKNTLANAEWKYFSPEKEQFALMKAGVSIKDIPIMTSSSTSNFTDLYGNTITTTTTTKSMNTDFKFGNQQEARLKYDVESGQKGKAYMDMISGGMWDVGQAGLIGLGLSGVGILGSSATEGGIVGQGLTTASGVFPKLGTALEFASKPAVQLSLVGISGAVKGYEGYKIGETTGLNPIATASISGVTGIGQYYAFTAGATEGEVSPFKVMNVKGFNPATGKSTEITTYNLGEPFTGKYFAVATKIDSSLYAGYAPSRAVAGLSIPDIPYNQRAFGTPEGESFIKHYGGTTPEYQIVTSTVGNLRMQNLKGTTNIDLANQKSFSGMSPAEQFQWTKEMQGLGSIENANSYGFRRFTGSISGYYNRPAGDIDVVAGANANSDQMASDIAGRMLFTSKGSQIYGYGGKMAEILTPENAIPQPMGYFGRYATTATIVGVGTPPSQTLVTKAGQSLTELGSAIRFPSGFDSSGVMTFGVDKTQRIVDFATTANKLSEVSGKAFDIGTFKSVYNTKYPNLNWGAGNIVSTGLSNSPSFSTASSVTSLAMAVFAPKGASSTSTNVRVFIPTRVSPSSRSSLPSISSAFSSLSSLSSISSFSSSSSRSSSSSSSSFSSLSSLSSSSSSSSFSSLSSLSSSSSSSSSSLSSSSSSSSSSIFFTPPPVIPFKFILGTDMGGLTSGRVKVRKITRYTPSYTAMVFNIKGKKPKGMETGLRVRPITPGFSFNNLFGKGKNILAPKRIRVINVRRSRRR